MEVRAKRGAISGTLSLRPPTDDHQYTAGCVSLARDDLLAVLGSCTPSTMIDIGAL
jgi:hypothetical protein